MRQARTYLDHNATAPLRPEAHAAVLAALATVGNPSSVHSEGRAARAFVEEARQRVARLVNAEPAEVFFTSGATEANNWLLRAGWDTVVVSAIEHDSVRAPARTGGARLVELPAGADGLARTEGAAAAPGRPGRCLVSLQMANNETGALQPVAAAVALGGMLGARVHTDAVQAAGRIAIDFAGLGLDALSLSSHKLGGPMGAGALVVRKGCDLPPFITGGGQERRSRAGTENVAAIAGFGAAAEAARRELAGAARLAALRDRLEREALAIAPQAVVVAGGAPRLPNTTSLALPGRAAETLVIAFDLAGIAVSAGAACSSGRVGASSVLAAMGLPASIARAAIRVSLGWNSTEEDVAAFLRAWSDIAGRAQRRAVA